MTAEAMMITAVGIGTSKSIRPRRARVSVVAYELRVGDGNTTDLRHRSAGRVEVLARRTSGHGPSNWMRYAASAIRRQLPMTLEQALEIATAAQLRRATREVLAAERRVSTPVDDYGRDEADGAACRAMTAALRAAGGGAR